MEPGETGVEKIPFLLHAAVCTLHSISNSGAPIRVGLFSIQNT
jgi:hypothetical protein